MKYSQTGARLTEGFESCRLVAYQDSKGVWTIGYGHTRDVFPGMTCSRQQAEAWLLQDIATAEYAVNRLVRVQLTQNEFDALVDLVFNIGTGNFQGSTMLRLLNAGDFKGAAEQFERWDKSGGVEISGLLRRRVAEQTLFNAAT